jgi:hypothetical protein
MAGRTLRPADGKTDCIILDHGGCFLAHGTVDAPREWSLDPDQPILQARGKGKSSPTLEVCEHCSAVIAAARQTCPECGASLVKEAETEEGEIRELEEVTQATLAASIDRRAWFRNCVRRVRHSVTWDGRPYNPKAAVAQYRSKFGVWPPWSWQVEEGLQSPFRPSRFGGPKGLRLALKHPSGRPAGQEGAAQ